MSQGAILPEKSEKMTALLDIFQVLTSKDCSLEETGRTMKVKLQNIEPAKANLFHGICEKHQETVTPCTPTTTFFFFQI